MDAARLHELLVDPKQHHVFALPRMAPEIRERIEAMRPEFEERFEELNERMAEIEERLERLLDRLGNEAD
jgi:hypothetical protein